MSLCPFERSWNKINIAYWVFVSIIIIILIIIIIIIRFLVVAGYKFFLEVY